MEICNEKLEEKIITLIQDRMGYTLEPINRIMPVLFVTQNIAFAIVHTEYFVKSRLYVFWEKNGKLRRKKIIETPYEICHPNITGRKARIKEGFVNIVVDFVFRGHCLYKKKPRNAYVLCHRHSAPLTIPLSLFE